jgi:hypothetical protein
MRFANIVYSLITSLTTFTTVLALAAVFPADLRARDLWRIAGQPALEFSTADRTRQVQQRLNEIIFNLDPSQPWTVDIFVPPVATPAPPVIPNPIPSSIPSPSPTPTPKPQRAIIRLQGQPLIEVTTTDAIFANAPGVVELANAWARTLTALFNQLSVRTALSIIVRMPAQIAYQGRNYTLRPEIALDRGLFRTNGRRVENRVIFWEVPPSNRPFVIDETAPAEPSQPPVIYLIHPRLFFVPYQRN